ncbi:MAG: hypothetical protein KKH29_02490 [Candidatus Omnitrophica bacterium]|nr:hypothetical protein [Candidatus Omnitrophota bacterium]MBU4473649.1 hypothetical protein [Candidatus Omnitrophota bacterium]MCG2707022.1 hypothetical protein [Candidatus Omnitrophota bacterium]
MRLRICLLLVVSFFLFTNAGLCQEKLIFGFEEDVPSWEIPDWCFEKEEYVAESMAISNKFAKEGNASLELMANFPGKKWTATYAEVQQFFDWTLYKTISADIYLPVDAPFGLRARFILTVGEDWKWIEMARLAKLVPGEWTTISADLRPGSTDWRRTEVTDEFRSDVRKLGMRLESDMKPVYSGPIYIDNVRLD